MQYYCIYRDLATYRIISDFQICQIKQMIYYIICVAAALRSLFSSLDNLEIMVISVLYWIIAQILTNLLWYVQCINSFSGDVYGCHFNVSFVA